MAMLKENTRELYNSTQDYWRIRVYSELDKKRVNVILDCYVIKNGVPDTSLIADVRQYDVDLTVIGDNLSTLATYTSIRTSYTLRLRVLIPTLVIRLRCDYGC